MVKKKNETLQKKIDPDGHRNFFSDRLRIVMRSKGWNQKSVSEIVGTTERTVSRWMRQNVKPAEGVIWKISAASGYNFYWLRDDDYDGPQLESARWTHEAREKHFTHQELSGLYYRLEEILNANGLSKEQLAAKAGLTCPIKPTSHYWIGHDEKIPSPRDIEKIAAATGYNKDWIWHGRGPRLASAEGGAEVVGEPPAQCSEAIPFATSKHVIGCKKLSADTTGRRVLEAIIELAEHDPDRFIEVAGYLMKTAREAREKREAAVQDEQKKLAQNGTESS